MKEIVVDSIVDTLKILPYLYLTFIILELIEHKISHKSSKILKENKKIGPLFGSILGGIPQCGFSVVASRLFSSRVITIGTLIAVYLATSDEMIPVMISEKVDLIILVKIIGLKILIGIIVGFIIDLICRRKEENIFDNINHVCEEDNCSCNEKSIFISSLKHTIKIGLFILIANLLIGILLEFIGSDNLSNMLLSKNIFTYFGASLIGLIPNCASSVIITKLYIDNLITIGVTLSGLLTGSGLGILILFKTNKNIKENILILSIIYFIGVILGIIIDLLI